VRQAFAEGDSPIGRFECKHDSLQNVLVQFETAVLYSKFDGPERVEGVSEDDDILGEFLLITGGHSREDATELSPVVGGFVLDTCLLIFECEFIEQELVLELDSICGFSICRVERSISLYNQMVPVFQVGGAI